jgi:hypothetical protein
MHPIHHKYPVSWFMKLYTILFDISGFIFPLFIFFYPLFKAISNHLPITFGEIVWLFIIAIFSGSCLILAGNFYTEIVSDKDGLHIYFLWKHLFVPWEEIIELKPLFNIPFLKNIWVIRTRSLTFFHRVYGLLYSFSLYPSLVFTKGISNYDELNRRIRVSLKKNRKSNRS